MRILNSTSLPACSIAQKGNFPKSLSVISTIRHLRSLTPKPQTFSSYNPCARNLKVKIANYQQKKNLKVKIANGSLTPMVDKGFTFLSKKLTLQLVLHVPNLSCNLLSISKLAQDRKSTLLVNFKN